LRRCYTSLGVTARLALEISSRSLSEVSLMLGRIASRRRQSSICRQRLRLFSSIGWPTERRPADTGSKYPLDLRTLIQIIF